MKTHGDGLVDCVDAAKMIPMKQGTLRVWLNRHKREFPPQYRRGHHRKRVRVLTSEEVERIKYQLGLLSHESFRSVPRQPIDWSVGALV